MKLNHESYKNAMNNIKVKETLNEQLLSESKDTDYEKWLVKKFHKEERKKGKKWLVLFILLFCLALYGFSEVFQYHKFFRHLEQDGTCITADYYVNNDIYKYYQRGKSGYAKCSKSILFEDQGDTMNLYYIGKDFTQAIPLLRDWVWAASYTVTITAMGICVLCMLRQIKRIRKNKI